MINKNLLPEKDRELIELAERFEGARSEQRSIYMDSEDLADLADGTAAGTVSSMPQTSSSAD